jgi:hypothetical protein
MRLAQGATMTDRPIFTTDVVKDIGNPNRFRWNIYENKRVRDKSFYSFATKREAQNDADKFVRKLDSIWPGSKE